MSSRLAKEFRVVWEWWASVSLGQNLHHGQIDVTSELNQGTSFIVSLTVQSLAGIASAGVSRHYTVASDQALKLAGEQA